MSSDERVCVRSVRKLGEEGDNILAGEDVFFWLNDNNSNSVWVVVSRPRPRPKHPAVSVLISNLIISCRDTGGLIIIISLKITVITNITKGFISIVLLKSSYLFLRRRSVKFLD